MADMNALLAAVRRGSKNAISRVQAAWAELEPAERDKLVVASVVGSDNWEERPVTAVLAAILKLGGNPDARVATDGDFYPNPKKTSALEICTRELKHSEHQDLVLSRKQVVERNAALIKAAESLVAAGANLAPYSARRSGSPLHDAARAGAYVLVALLLKRGANPNAVDRDGETPLFAAARSDDVAMVQALLAKGAKNVRNRRGDSAVVAAFGAAAFHTYAVLHKRLGGPDLASAFARSAISVDDAKRMLARLREASFTSISVSGKEDPASLALIKKFSLKDTKIVATIDRAKLPKLPHAIGSKLLEAIGLEAKRILEGAKLDINAYNVGPANPWFSVASGLGHAKAFVESKPPAPSNIAKRLARPARRHPMQPDHLVESTEALLVWGWRTRADFDDIDQRVAAFEHALTKTRAVFVAATDFPNGGSCICDVVVGWPAARARANDGPVAISPAKIREAGANTALPDAVSAALAEHLLAPIKGKPKWHLVPTGPLAGGMVAFGGLVRSDDEDDALIGGCTMAQESHDKSVRGERIASSYRWDVVAIHANKLAPRKSGKHWVIAAYS